MLYLVIGVVPLYTCLRGSVNIGETIVTAQGSQLSFGSGRFVVWGELRLLGAPPSNRRFPLVIDTGFNGFLALRWEVIQECLGLQLVEGLRLEGSDRSFKTNEYGAYLNTNYELYLSPSEVSNRSFRLASSNKIQVYLSKKLVESKGKFLSKDALTSWQSEKRPKVPLMGMNALRQSKVTLIVSNGNFVLSRWPWRKP